MNKAVQPKQLDIEEQLDHLDQLDEPTPTQTRKMLVAGLEDFDKKCPAPTAEEAVDNFLAKRVHPEAVMGSGLAFKQQPSEVDDPDEFDWNNPEEDAIVLRDQRATAVYRNKVGEVIIRQQGSWPDDDTFLYLAPGNEVAFMEGMAEKLRK